MLTYADACCQVFYRISYLRWLVGLAAAEMLFARY